MEEEIKNIIRKIKENRKNKVKKDVKYRKNHENEKLKCGLKKIYRKYGLYENNKLLSLDKLEELINELNIFNYVIEKNEYLFKEKFKYEISKLKVEGLEKEKRERKIKRLRGNEEDSDEEDSDEEESEFFELDSDISETESDFDDLESDEEEEERVKKTIINISKNEFVICKNYKNKKNLSKYIRKLFRRYKWLDTSYCKFLKTRNFKNFKEIKKIRIFRNGIVKCYNKYNEIKCMYFFFLNDKFFNKLRKNNRDQYREINGINDVDHLYHITKRFIWWRLGKNYMFINIYN